MGLRKFHLLAVCILFGTAISLLDGCGPTSTIAPGVTLSPTRITPTSTATRTIPSSTPRPAPSSTPLPTPVPTPSPLAVEPKGYPLLPADLYFLREGRLWHWPAGGNLPQAIAPLTTTEAIVYYTLAPEQNRVAYLTREGQVRVLDTQTGRERTIPLAGYPLPLKFNETYQCFCLIERDTWCFVNMDILALSPNGRYLLYLDWEAMPTNERDLSGSLRAVDLEGSGGVQEIASCGIHPGLEEWGGCRGFRLSPNGDHVAFIDGQGLWVARVPAGQLRLIQTYEDVPDPADAFPDHIWSVLQWSPDGRWLLGEETGFETFELVLIDAGSGRIHRLPHAGTFVENYAVAVWGPTGVWVGYGDEEGPSGLYLAQPGEGDTVQVSRQITTTEYGILWPRSLYPLPDGQLVFANRRCTNSPGPETGLFLLQTNGRLDYIAPLPPPSCCWVYSPECFGRVLWSPDGQAFLYLDGSGASLLGRSDGSALWDVRTLLEKGKVFRWTMPGRGKN